MSERLGWTVVALRPDRRNPTAQTVDVVGGVWPERGPCDNHQAYCEMSAADNPERYGQVKYRVVQIVSAPSTITDRNEER